MPTKKSFQTIDEYIDTFPSNVRTKLKSLRAAIKSVIPKAEQVISYQIPTFKLNGKYVIYFAAWKTHIAIYPIHIGTEGLTKQMAKYRGSKSSLHFPLDKPIPLALVKKIVKRKAAAIGTEKKPVSSRTKK